MEMGIATPLDDFALKRTHKVIGLSPNGCLAHKFARNWGYDVEDATTHQTYAGPVREWIHLRTVQ
jgi:hypothetical protein